MLTDTSLEQILARLPDLRIGVVGDLFLDRYLDIDAGLTEPSIETGLDAFQVVRVRSIPGAAGTVINNLAALGVARVLALAVIGDDGEGYELRGALQKLGIVDPSGIVIADSRRTPTYTKPMFQQAGQPARELNRLDIKNRTPLPRKFEDRVLQSLEAAWPQVDGLIVLDQVREAECGVVTARVRDRLAELGEAEPTRMILADSRERIGLFRSVWLKPNVSECSRAVGRDATDAAQIEACVRQLAARSGRPVFCTCGERGLVLVDPRPGTARATRVPAYPVVGPTDPVGAGDSATAGIACALAAGAGIEEAAAFGNLVASITIQQIGTTGTATPDQVRHRWRQVCSEVRP